MELFYLFTVIAVIVAIGCIWAIIQLNKSH